MNMNAESSESRIRNDLLAARKARDAIKVQALGSVVNAIDNAGAVQVSDDVVDAGVTEASRRVLLADDVETIIRNEIREMKAALVVYGAAYPDRAAALESRIAVLRQYVGPV